MTNGTKGAILALTGSLLWGSMGVMCQYLLQDRELPAIWLIDIRMLVAGPLLLLVDYYLYARKHGAHSFTAVWQGSKNISNMVVFGLVSILGVQLGYLSGVYYLNVATATVFVSLAPIVMLSWMCVREKKLPKVYESLCCFSAVMGVILMATRGDITGFSFGLVEIFVALMLPLSGAIYTVQPQYIMKHYRASNANGWGMVLAAVVLTPFIAPWNVPIDLTLFDILCILYVAVFGTAIAFWAFLSSLQYIKPHIAGIYELSEALSAIFLSVWLLDVVFAGPEWVATILILVPVVYLALKHKE